MMYIGWPHPQEKKMDMRIFWSLWKMAILSYNCFKDVRCPSWCPEITAPSVFKVARPCFKQGGRNGQKGNQDLGERKEAVFFLAEDAHDVCMMWCVSSTSSNWSRRSTWKSRSRGPSSISTTTSRASTWSRRDSACSTFWTRSAKSVAFFSSSQNMNTFDLWRGTKVLPQHTS